MVFHLYYTFIHLGSAEGRAKTARVEFPLKKKAMASNLNTASSLRWRARVTKEAVLNDDDDSQYYSPGKPQNNRDAPSVTGDRWEMIEASKETPFSGGYYQSLWKILLNSVAATAVGCSVYAQTRVLSVMVTNTTLQLILWFVIFISCTLTAVFSLLAVWQRGQLLKYGSIRALNNRLRATVRSLKQQNERLCRNLTLLDGSIDRLGHVENELALFTNNSASDAQRLVAVVKEHKQLQQELQDVVRQQVQEQILQAVLQTDSNRDCSLSAQELERLIVRLKRLPGVKVREDQLRSLLVRQSDARSNLPLTCILKLIRQVGDDAQKPPVASLAESPRHINLQDEEDDDATVFRFCPLQLVSDSTREGELISL